MFDATPKTLGGVVDRNEGPGRRYWLESKRRDLAESRDRGMGEIEASLPAGMTRAPRETPERRWYHSGNDPRTLASLTPEQKQSYIDEGKV